MVRITKAKIYFFFINFLIFVISTVIDFCLTKALVTDTNTNVTSLQLDWASKNNCRQRSGRAGRLMSGKVYRMVPQAFYDVSFFFIFIIFSFLQKFFFYF